MCGSLNILWHYLSLELKSKLTFFSPGDTAEFSKIAGIFSAALIITVNLLLKIVQTYYIQLVCSWLKFGSCLYSIGYVSIKHRIFIQTFKKKKTLRVLNIFFFFYQLCKDSTKSGPKKLSFQSQKKLSLLTSDYWKPIQLSNLEE